MKHATFLLSLFLLACSASFAQQSTGIIDVRVVVGPALPSGVQLSLREVSTREIVQQAPFVRRGDQVVATFRDVPFARYTVELTHDTAVVASRTIVVASTVRQEVLFDFSENARPVAVVSGEAPRAAARELGTSTILTARTIEELPVASSAHRIESVLLSAPGVVPDEDGRMHVRGEDAQLQYVIDGIPITANMTRVYAPLFNANTIKSIDIQTGGLEAEYGVATSAVAVVTTKSGFDGPVYNMTTGEIGTFGTQGLGLQIGANFGVAAGYFASGGWKTDRYLDPIALGDPIHSYGDVRHNLLKANVVLGDATDLTLLGTYNSTIFEIPNTSRESEQNQVQDLADLTIGARLNVGFDSLTTLGILGYYRHAAAQFTSSGFLRIDTSNPTIAFRNEKFFIGADRSNDAIGAQLELTRELDLFDAHHTLKLGVGGELIPLDEFFTFAVTNSNISNPDSAGGDIRYQPYDLTRAGGRPFLVDTSLDGRRFSAFLQDRFSIDKLLVSLGVRFDRYELVESENAISPRLALAYRANDNLTLRLSYNRMVMQPPIENLLVSSSRQARELTGAEQDTIPTNVKSERSHVFEAGAAIDLGEHVSLDVVGYGKLLENFIAKVELGNSGIIFPVNLKEGLVAGGELRANVHDWNSLDIYLALSGGVALGLKPEDGSSPVAAGLILGEEGRNYSKPFAGEDAFPTEHNQLFTGVLGVTYRFSDAVRATLRGRFDSGLPFDLAGPDGKGLSAEESRIELRRRGYSDQVIDLLELEPEAENPDSPDKSVAPHAIFDFGGSIDLSELFNLQARVEVIVTNVFDTPYLYKFESSFGGTHFGGRRAIVARAVLSL